MESETNEQLHWPKKGDNPFSGKNGDYRSPTWCLFPWPPNLDLDDTYYANAFKKAGDKIISELERGESIEHADPMFIPVAYLYRHCLELKMKAVIKKGLKLNILPGDEEKIKASLIGHNLHKIWNQFKLIVMAYWPGADTTDLNAAESIVLRFHAIDASGQSLRYAESTDGSNSAEKMPESIELTALRDTFDGVFNLLDGCDMESDHRLGLLK